MALASWIRPEPLTIVAGAIIQAGLFLAATRPVSFRRSNVGAQVLPMSILGLLSLAAMCLADLEPQASPAPAVLWATLVPLLSSWLLAARSWGDWRTRPAVAVVSATAAALSAAWMAARLAGSSVPLLGATAGLAWGSMVAALLLHTEPLRGASLAASTSPSWRDYLALTKPVIVVLLLVTTLTGMVVGAGQWPEAGLLGWTLLGGALSAGGASAMNQYIDRDLDRRMQRTERRPFPSGRIGEAEGLAYAIVLCIAGFYTLALAVNQLSALLALAGMLYYVVLYSLVLKKTTTQNIVVGGGAGAIPPLVGWAAATGSLSMAAFFLFAVIFFWTPPHFWALALLRRQDYARAGIPMLPAVESERSSAWQILLYAVQLVALTLLLPLAGVGGALFLIAAVPLGLGFVVFAWRLWKHGGNRPAYGLYRYSSMYLALLFAALVVDTLVRI